MASDVQGMQFYEKVGKPVGTVVENKIEPQLVDEVQYGLSQMFLEVINDGGVIARRINLERHLKDASSR